MRLANLSKQTVASHANLMAFSNCMLVYIFKLGSFQLGYPEPYCLIVNSYLDYVSDRFALECPTGRKSQDGLPVVILLSDMIEFGIYEDYIDSFDKLRRAVDGIAETKIPTAPLKFSTFTR